MKKIFLSVLIAGVLEICVLTGCQKAPEASSDSGVYHAKSSLEDEVENIVAKEPDRNTTKADEAEPGGSYDALVGTEENGIWICAEVPVVPKTVQALTLQERDDWDTEKLKELLHSEGRKVQDITAEYLAQREKELSEMNEEDKPGEWLNFGDDSFMLLSDGKKEASFAGNTCVSYEDKILKKNCGAIYKKAPEIDVKRDSEAISPQFPVSRAKEILLEKLAILDIEEIYISEGFYYELDGTAFYELVFTPSYEMMGVASEFGKIALGEVQPRGTAWITEDGIATMSLNDYCGKITEQSETGNVLTFPQVTDILERYLENDTLCGNSEDKEWQEATEEGAAWNIYLDAVTGELIKVE